MPKERITVTLDAELGAEVRVAASAAGLSVSAWLARAVEDRVRHDRLGEALAAWEEQDGPVPESMLTAAGALFDKAAALKSKPVDRQAN